MVPIDIKCKIGLGTAQFGLNYGLTNTRGKVSESQICNILDFAWKSGVRILDTARVYGDSEAVLGRVLSSKDTFKIVTKITLTKEEALTQKGVNNFRKSFEDSLNLLGRSSVYGLLIHDSKDIFRFDSHHLIRCLEELKKGGLVKKIGGSVYFGHEIDGILNRFTPDIIQLPFNVVDRRLAESGHLAKLNKLGVEVHARSLFLQGVLLKEPKDLPKYFAPIKRNLTYLNALAVEHGLSKLEVCFAAALAQPEIGTFVIGITSLLELEQTVEAVKKVREKRIKFPQILDLDQRFIDPSKWPSII